MKTGKSKSDLWSHCVETGRVHRKESNSSLVKQKIPTGHEAMLEAFPSYKHHALPPWLKKTIRAVAIKKGKWRAGETHVNYITTDREFPGLWDHWGSLKIDDEFALITQPYRGTLWISHEALIRFAEKFAEDHSCSLQILDHGVWHPSTCAFIFSKPSTL
jgi:hypothetical protein